jgi:hypothetical protein
MKWRPIETAPPEVDTGVIGWDNYFKCIVIAYRSERGHWADDGVICHLTHWMPLPKPPEDESCT